MRVTRTSRTTGETRTLDLDITESELIDFGRGATVLEAFPRLSPAHREFFMTGDLQSDLPKEENNEKL